MQRFPDKFKLKAYPLIQGLQSSVECYCNTKTRGDGHITEEFVRKKSGRKGKALPEWIAEHDRLKAEQNALRKAATDAGLGWPPNDRKLWNRYVRLENRMMTIDEKVEKDFGISLA